jgi:hypothetical protein
MEVLASVNSIAAVMEQVITLINQVRNAVKYQRELPSLLDAYRQQLEYIKNIVVIVEENRGSRLKLLLLHLARLECSRIDSKST